MSKKLLSMVCFILISTPAVYGSEPDVKIEVSSPTSSVFRGEGFAAMIHVTNIGTTDLKLADSQYAKFKEQWMIDNPQVQFSGGVSIVNVEGQVPEILLKPGQEHSDQVHVYVSGNAAAEPIVFRMGFKITPNAAPMWSNPISIQIKEDEALAVQIDVSIPTTQVKSWESIEVSAHIQNSSDHPQHIGTEICGVPGVIGWVTDNQSVFVQGGSSGCLSNISPPVEIILKPSEAYAQQCTVSFDKMNITRGPLSFRIGLKNMGHLPAWSNAIALSMEEGTEEQEAQWKKSDVYHQEFAAEENVASKQDGIVKRLYESGELYDERTVKDGKLNGPTRYYYKSGTLMKEVGYVNGKPTHWVDYNPDGSVQFDSTPLDGKMGDGS